MKIFATNRWSIIIICVLALIIAAQLILGVFESPTIVEASLSATFEVDGEATKLTDGRHFVETEDDQGIATWMYGLPVTGDINGDGSVDAGMLLLRSSGGTERYCYIAAVIDRGIKGAAGTNAILLGNGVAINYCMISDNVLTVSYYEISSGSALPVESQRYFTVTDGTLIELTEQTY